MRKCCLLVAIFVVSLFVNICDANAICNQTSPDWPNCLNNSSGSSGSSSGSSSDSCINNCNNSAACRTSPNGQACAQCKANCQAQANDDKEDWEDPTEDFDSDATSNADDATGSTSDDAADNTENAQDISEAQRYCYDNYEINSEEFNKCILDATANPDKNNDSDVDTSKIVDWASNQGYEVNSIGDPCNIISPKLQSLLNTIFWAISIIGIILVVVMTALGFIKAIVGSDDEKFRDAFRHLLTRIIVVIILLLLPAILSFIITLINDSSTGEVTVGKDGNVFCDIAN